MNTPPVIELREYEKRTDIDLQLDEKDQQLSEELKQKGILTITGDPISHKLKFEASSLIGVAQFTNFTVTINPKFTNIENLVKLINYVYDLDMSYAAAGVYLVQMGNSSVGYKTGRIIVK